MPASRAALIYLLEPVFAAILSIVVGHDSVTGRLLLGGALILSGNALVELPLWMRHIRGTQPDNNMMPRGSWACNAVARATHFGTAQRNLMC